MYGVECTMILSTSQTTRIYIVHIQTTSARNTQVAAMPLGLISYRTFLTLYTTTYMFQ